MLIDQVTDALEVAEDDGHRLYALTRRAEQAPTLERRIQLGDNTDALGLPRVELDGQIPESTRESIETTLQYIGAEFGRVGVGRLWMPSTTSNSTRPTPHSAVAITWGRPG
jgi:hypothetical protein